MKEIKVACFGLQGFGNDLLATLHQHSSVRVTEIYTREPEYSFQYYECDSLESVAEVMGVPVVYVPRTGEWDCADADLALISSFHRILKEHHLSRYRYTINIHPSLLPGYRGATPTNWMIKQGERIVGLTAYLVDVGVDTGDVLFQKSMLNPYLCDNELRRALSFLTREVIEEIIDRYPRFVPIEPVEGVTGSYSRGRREEDALIRMENVRSIDELIFHIKAFTNYPMPKLEVEGKIFIIDYEKPLQTLEIVLEGRSFSILGYWSESSQE